MVCIIFGIIYNWVNCGGGGANGFHIFWIIYDLVNFGSAGAYGFHNFLDDLGFSEFWECWGLWFP